MPTRFLAGVLPSGVLSFALIVLSSSAQAVFYGDFQDAGSAVMFTDVQDIDGLYGEPTVNGDNLDFNPGAANPNPFRAECIGAGPGDFCGLTVDDTLTMGVEIDQGLTPAGFIDDLLITEAGDTFLAVTLANDFAQSTVTASIFVEVFEIDFAAVGGLVQDNFSMTFAPANLFSESGAGGPASGTTIFTGSILVDIDQIIADAGEVGRATKIGVTIDNTLDVTTVDGGRARIQKKDFDALSIAVVPEPASGALLGLGLVALGVRRQRRS